MPHDLSTIHKLTNEFTVIALTIRSIDFVEKRIVLTTI